MRVERSIFQPMLAVLGLGTGGAVAGYTALRGWCGVWLVAILPITFYFMDGVRSVADILSYVRSVVASGY